MQKESKFFFGEIKLLDIESSEPYNWDTQDVSHVRVSLPPAYENEKQMLERGYFLADRTLSASINLTRNNIDYGKLVRHPVVLSSDRNNEIFEIAKQSFPTDRRFNISPTPNPAIANAVLAEWVNELKGVYICEIKGKAVGFLALTREDDANCFVHLAAVLKRYRVTGAGVSLYATVARDCKASGVKFLNGRISSTNTSVMNLYSQLGATFSDPLDVYLKEI